MLKSAFREYTPLGSLLFWDTMQHRLVVGSQCFGTSYQSYQSNFGTIGYPKTLVTNYKSMLL